MIDTVRGSPIVGSSEIDCDGVTSTSSSARVKEGMDSTGTTEPSGYHTVSNRSLAKPEGKRK